MKKKESSSGVSPGVQRVGTGGVSSRSLTQLQSIPPLHLHSNKPTKFECEPFSVRPQNIRLKHNTLTPQILVDSFHPLHTSVSEHAVVNHEGMSFRYPQKSINAFSSEGFL